MNIDEIPAFDPGAPHVTIDHPNIGPYIKQKGYAYFEDGTPMDIGAMMAEARNVREAAFLFAREEIRRMYNAKEPNPDNLPTSTITVNDDGNFDNVPAEAVRVDYLREWAESQGVPYPGAKVVGRMVSEIATARRKGREPDLPVTPGGNRP